MAGAALEALKLLRGCWVQYQRMKDVTSKAGELTARLQLLEGVVSRLADVPEQATRHAGTLGALVADLRTAARFAVYVAGGEAGARGAGFWGRALGAGRSFFKAGSNGDQLDELGVRLDRAAGALHLSVAVDVEAGVLELRDVTATAGVHLEQLRTSMATHEDVAMVATQLSQMQVVLTQLVA